VKGYYFITDAACSRRGNKSDVRQALEAGVEVVQYREKFKSTREMVREALELRKICRDVIFLVNDRVDIALAAGADGVHLGCEDMPYAAARKLLGSKKIIGLTVHRLCEALRAQREGAQYLGVSPIFATKTKEDAGRPAGLALIRKIKQRVSLPLVAIGGINLSNAESVIRAGADSLCAISAVVTATDVKGQIQKFQRLFTQSQLRFP
jgi:thiamine-phosphate pyrophosphorylase